MFKWRPVSVDTYKSLPWEDKLNWLSTWSLTCLKLLLWSFRNESLRIERFDFRPMGFLAVNTFEMKTRLLGSSLFMNVYNKMKGHLYLSQFRALSSSRANFQNLSNPDHPGKFSVKYRAIGLLSCQVVLKVRFRQTLSRWFQITGILKSDR